MTIECVRIGNATLYHGDCREVLPGINRVDAVLTDPPYGTQDLGGGYGRRQNWDQGDRLGRVIANDRDLSALQGAIPEIKRIVAAGWICIFYSPKKTAEFYAVASELNHFGDLVWCKAKIGLGYQIRYAHEAIAVFRHGGKPETSAQAMPSVLRVHAEAKEHPHEKPVSLLQPIVEWACPWGGVTLDPFMGSGSTGVACALARRKFIGVEIDRKYFDISCRRIEAAQVEAAQGSLLLDIGHD